VNTPGCTDDSSIQCLVASQGRVRGMEAARVQPRAHFAPAHDAFTRLGQQPASLARILRVDGGLGPIAGATLPPTADSRPCLYLGRGRAVLQLEET
jgi:hypothetical protein